jgi:hypothetical protein
MDKDINLVTMAVIVKLLKTTSYKTFCMATNLLRTRKINSKNMCLVKNTSTPLYSNLRPYNLFLVS